MFERKKPVEKAGQNFNAAELIKSPVLPILVAVGINILAISTLVEDAIAGPHPYRCYRGTCFPGRRVGAGSRLNEDVKPEKGFNYETQDPWEVSDNKEFTDNQSLIASGKGWPSGTTGQARPPRPMRYGPARNFETPDQTTPIQVFNPNNPEDFKFVSIS